jgi:hypothetical protein
MTEPLGVAFTPPPAERLGPISKALDDAFKDIPTGARGALIGVGNEKGVNAVLVMRGPKGFDVQAWIGKSWGGSLEYGAAVRKVF